MRYFIICIIVVVATYLVIHKSSTCSTDPLLRELEQLARNSEMEFVIGNKFPVVNPYGSYGSTYVFDFVSQSGNNSLEHSVLFLCRKKRTNYIKKKEERILELVHNYNYYLVFATKMEGKNTYKIQDIISDIGLKGMSLYYGSLNIDLTQLKYINKPDVIVPKEVLLEVVNKSIPVLISSESATQFLFYYKGKWLEYVERDI